MKIAILGAGQMGTCHAEVYKRLGITPIIISRDREKARALAVGGKSLTRLEDLEPNEADAIDICLPNYMHREAILCALELSHSIICEKPLCLGMDQLIEIESAVQKHAASLMVAQVVRFWDSHLAVKNAAEDGIEGITCARRQKKPNWSKENWIFDKDKSGGIIYELAIHDIDFVVDWLGMPKGVKAFQNELNATVILDYGDFAANIFASWEMPAAYNKGKMETRFEVLTRTSMVNFDSKKSTSCIEIYEDSAVEKKRFDTYDAYEKQLEYFTHCIKNKIVADKSNLQSVKNTMKVLEMCRR